MGRFSKLLEGKGKEVKLGDETFVIKPLSARYLGLFMNTDKDKQAEASVGLVVASLKQTDDTITDDDVKELPLKTFNEVVEVIMEVNELDKE